MTDAEIASIEQALGIRLPDAYRAVVAAYPVRACAGNDDTELWDNAARLIELNQELRSGRYGVTPWPPGFFSLGTDAGGCCQALNLTDGTVLWADRCHLPVWGPPYTPVPFSIWCDEYVAGLRSDLEGDGIDPDGSAGDARRQMDLNNRSSDRAGCGCMVLLLAILATVIVWRLLR
jgi:hypothetical protein